MPKHICTSEQFNVADSPTPKNLQKVKPTWTWGEHVPGGRDGNDSSESFYLKDWQAQKKTNQNTRLDSQGSRDKSGDEQSGRKS